MRPYGEWRTVIDASCRAATLLPHQDHAALSVKQPKRTVAAKAQSRRKGTASPASRSPYGSTCCLVAGSQLRGGEG